MCIEGVINQIFDKCLPLTTGNIGGGENMNCDGCQEEGELFPRMYDGTVFFYCRECAPRNGIDPQEGVVE